jgi:hypothetical protein
MGTLPHCPAAGPARPVCEGNSCAPLSYRGTRSGALDSLGDVVWLNYRFLGQQIPRLEEDD